MNVLNVLVTGASGFSGSAATMALLAAGHHVTAVLGSRRGRLPEDAELRGKLEVLTGDLSGGLPLPRKLDVVVHAAARSPAPGVTDADLTRSNVLATQRLVQKAKGSGVSKFIYLSSLSVYGRILAPVVDEATAISEPDAYGRTKRIAEELISAESSSFCSLAIRLPGVIGRGSVRNWLTGVLQAAKEGGVIEIFNPDAPFNNAVHVQDLASFLCRLVDLDWQGSDAVTVAAGGQIVVRDAVKMLVEAFGSRSSIRTRSAQRHSFLVSSDRARDRYGYQPMEIGAMLRRFAAENSDR